MPLNYTNSIPLHLQLKQELEKKIYSGVYKDKIPSEREIMAEYYVSRSTVRQSVDQLVKEGLLVRKPGKGTFIVFKPINEWLGNLATTSEIIERLGMVPKIKLLKSEIINVDDKIIEVAKEKKLYYIKRLRYANNTPIGIERHYFPISIGRELIKYNLNSESIYDLLEKNLDIKAFEAKINIKAENCDKDDAKLLNIAQP